MGIDTQGYIGAGVAKPLADGHDVHAGVDQLRCARVAQAVEGDLRHPETIGYEPPSLRRIAGGLEASLDSREHQRVDGQLAGTDGDTALELRAAVIA